MTTAQKNVATFYGTRFVQVDVREVEPRVPDLSDPRPRNRVVIITAADQVFAPATKPVFPPPPNPQVCATSSNDEILWRTHEIFRWNEWAFSFERGYDSLGGLIICYPNTRALWPNLPSYGNAYIDAIKFLAFNLGYSLQLGIRQPTEYNGQIDALRHEDGLEIKTDIVLTDPRLHMRFELPFNELTDDRYGLRFRDSADFNFADALTGLEGGFVYRKLGMLRPVHEVVLLSIQDGLLQARQFELIGQ